MSATRALASSFPLFSVGAMAYGAARAYNNFQDTSSSPISYLSITMGVIAAQNSWTLILPTAASPNATGVGIGMLTLAGATLYQCGMAYAAMKAGEQIGIAARPAKTENRELR
jgi:hypothetical protein